MNTKYKPITFINGKIGPQRNNVGQQMLLLKAMTITSDPKKLKQMIGVKTVAEVFRTLDKLALRKEYHAALVDNGIDFNYIVSGLKEIGDKANDKTRLAALTTLLKSLGMDKYDVADEGGTGDWESVLMEKIKKDEEKKALGPESIEGDFEDVEEYEVVEVEAPESMKEIKEKDKRIGDSLYNRDLYE